MHHRSLHLSLQRLVHRHKLMPSRCFDSLVSSLTATAEVLGTLHTKWSGIFLSILTDFTLDFIRIHLLSRRTRGSSDKHRGRKEINRQRWGRDSCSRSGCLLAFSASTSFLPRRFSTTTGTASAAAGVGISKTARHTRHLKGALPMISIQMRFYDCNHKAKIERMNQKKSTVWNQQVKTVKTSRMQAW